MKGFRMRLRVMGKPSYTSNLIIGAVVIIFLQPLLFIGGTLYHLWANYGPNLLTFLFFVVWALVFVASLWTLFVKLRGALAVANSVIRKLLLIAVVLAGSVMACVVCYPLAVNPVGARWIPAEEPSEDRRVVHPKGFSIISPPGWKVRTFDFEDLEVSIALDPGSKARHSPDLGARILSSSPDLSKYQETEFLGQKAFEKTVTGKGENARMSYELVVEKNNRWYGVRYSESRAFESNPSSEFPEIMNHYIRSFRPSP